MRVKMELTVGVPSTVGGAAVSIEIVVDIEAYHYY